MVQNSTTEFILFLPWPPFSCSKEVLPLCLLDKIDDMETFPFTRGLNLYFQFSPGRNTLQRTLSRYFRVSCFSSLVSVFRRYLFPLMNSLCVRSLIQHAWHFYGWQFPKYENITFSTFQTVIHFKWNSKCFITHTHTRSWWITGVFRYHEVPWALGKTTMAEYLVLFKYSLLHFHHLRDSMWTVFLTLLLFWSHLN